RPPGATAGDAAPATVTRFRSLHHLISGAAMIAVSLLTALAVAAPVPVREDKPPTGPAPEIIAVVEVDAGSKTIITQHVVQRQVPVTVPKEVENAGVKMVVFVTEYKVVLESFRRKNDLTRCTASTADGKEVPAKELFEKLKPGAIALLSV